MALMRPPTPAPPSAQLLTGFPCPATRAAAEAGWHPAGEAAQVCAGVCDHKQAYFLAVNVTRIMCAPAQRW